MRVLSILLALGLALLGLRLLNLGTQTALRLLLAQPVSPSARQKVYHNLLLGFLLLVLAIALLV